MPIRNALAVLVVLLSGCVTSRHGVVGIEAAVVGLSIANEVAQDIARQRTAEEQWRQQEQMRQQQLMQQQQAEPMAQPPMTEAPMAGGAGAPPLAPQPRPGGLRIAVVSPDAYGWDVLFDDGGGCSTPCTVSVQPIRPVLLRAHPDSYARRPDEVFLPHLMAYADSGAIQIEPHRTAKGELATGITFTTLGGMAAITGLTLFSVGCLGQSSDGLCRAGAVTLGIGSLVTAGAIWLIVDSLPQAVIRAGL